MIKSEDAFGNIPVVLCLFKRADQTRKVLNSIRKYTPKKLFIIADGPRNGLEKEAVLATRGILEEVDWQCEIYKNYSTINLGGKKRISSGISWVFEHVDKAIILEDDCVPNKSFFRFCEELLEKYSFDKRVMQIAGANFQYGRKRTKNSYYFSIYPLCWGWATWKRAWENFDIDIARWPEAKRDKILREILNNRRAERYWENLFQSIYDGQIKHGWDYRWTLACWLQRGLTITPEVNLTSNIGNTIDASHMQNTSSHLMNLEVSDLSWPLKHCSEVVQNHEADNFTFDAYYNSPLHWKLSRKFKKIFGKRVHNPW